MARKPPASQAQVGTPSSSRGGLPRAEVVPAVIASELAAMYLERQPEIGSTVTKGSQPPDGIVNPTEIIVAPKPEQKSKRKYKSNDPLNNKPKKTKVPTRRSGRLQSTATPDCNTDIAPLVDDLNALAREGEVSRRAFEKIQPREASLQENYLEGKVASLFEAVEQLRICFEALHSKFEKLEEAHSSCTPGVETSTGNSHKECQKKIEALVNENRELAKKLENHSKGNVAFGELLEKVKDIMLLFGP